ncbi:MAG: hypothetical protein HY071_01870 [Chloroflexi bacterium]|nr:hypothetical protein [Chloroflexota bacterium]
MTLATTTLVALFALSRGIQLDVLKRSSTPFLTIVQVLPAAPAAGVSPRALDESAVRDIRTTPHVREALPAIVVPASITVSARQVSGTIIGLTPGGRAPYALAAGRAPTSSENDGVVLTPAGARSLGLAPDAALGLALQMELHRGDTRSERRTMALRVVGVAADEIRRCT